MMKNIICALKNHWRKFVSAAFVLLIFTMPSAKGFVTDIFNLSAEAGQQDKKKKPPVNSAGQSNNSNSQASFSSVSHPSSHSTASPCSNTHSSSSTSSFG